MTDETRARTVWPDGLGGGLVGILEEEGRQALTQVPDDVVGEHPQGHVRSYAGLPAWLATRRTRPFRSLLDWGGSP
jgi:hypothetical protein